MKLKIDELAQKTGTTSRNIRAYQAKGLLHPPELDGRTGYYDEDHLRRLEIIADLQERGFSLEAIRQVIVTWASGGDIGHLIGFHNLLSAPFGASEPEDKPDASALLEAYPEVVGNPALIQRAIDLDVIEMTPDGRLIATDRMLLDAGLELGNFGVPAEVMLDLVEALRADVKDMSDRFLRIASEYVLEPLVDGGDVEMFKSTLTSLETLLPIAMEIARPFLAHAMRTSIDDTVARLSATLEEQSAAEPTAADG